MQVPSCIMSGEKPTTPISSPKLPKTMKLETPTTPPSRHKQKRISASFLKTPEQPSDMLAFSPSYKRNSSGNYKSPDYKFNAHVAPSPYSSLKTPRHTGYDSDDSNERIKFQKTPQYLSPGKKLFNDDSNNKEGLSEISLQLKSKLSSAADKLHQQQRQQEKVPAKIDFNELSFSPATSPTKKQKSNQEKQWNPTSSGQTANLNLQTLQQSPVPASSPSFLLTPLFQQSRGLKQSPTLPNDHQSHTIHIPSIDDEESSAHNALMAALTRQRRKSRTSFSSSQRRPSSTPTLYDSQPSNLAQPLLASGSLQHIATHGQSSHHSQQPPLKLPPINSNNPKDSDKPVNEQDAVLSLMSLSSPQSVKFSHSRTQSLNNNSPGSSRSSSVAINSPGHQSTNTKLPPISGLINPATSRDAKKNYDNDETDVEDDATDDDIDNGINNNV